MVYFVDTLVCESAESWLLEASFVWNLLIWRLWMQPKKCDSGFQFCPMSLNIGWDQWLIQLHCLQTSNTKTDSDYRSESKVSASWWRLASATHLGRRHDRYSGSWAARAQQSLVFIFWCLEISVLKWRFPKMGISQIIHFNRIFHYNHAFWGTTILGSLQIYKTPFLMCEWSISNVAPEEGATVVDASATLGKFVNDELLHIQERPSRRSDSFVAVEVPEMRDSTLIGSRTKSAVRILRAQWTYRKLLGIDPMGVLGSGELCQVVLHHHPALHRAVAQLAAFGCFWGVIPIRSHQKWWTFPCLGCLGGWCRRPWSISQRRQVLGGDFPWLMVPGHFQNLSGTWVRWLPMNTSGWEVAWEYLSK